MYAGNITTLQIVYTSNGEEGQQGCSAAVPVRFGPRLSVVILTFRTSIIFHSRAQNKLLTKCPMDAAGGPGEVCIEMLTKHGKRGQVDWQGSPMSRRLRLDMQQVHTLDRNKVILYQGRVWSPHH